MVVGGKIPLVPALDDARSLATVAVTNEIKGPDDHRIQDKPMKS